MRSSKLFTTFLSIFCILIAEFGSVQSCSIDMEEIRNNEPIFLKLNRDFVIPNGKIISLKNGERILIDCGQGRTLKNSNFNNKQQIEAVCNGGTVTYGGQSFEQQPNLNCTDNNSIVRIERTLELCGGDGRIFRIGFHVMNNVGTQMLAPVLEVCFDEGKKSIFYVKSHIYGTVNRNEADDYVDPNINNGHFTTGESVKPEFFGVTNLQGSYKGFDRGHYAPNSDYQFAPHRRSTFFYFNMGPMAASFNRGKWKTIENLARRNARGVTADILTGGFYYDPSSKSSKNPSLQSKDGKLDLLNNNNDLVNDQRRTFDGAGTRELESIVIPNFFWKIVKIGLNKIAYVMPTVDNLELPAECMQYCTVNNQRHRYYECNVAGFKSCTNIIKGNFVWPADF
ncbi:unnamed protein product [Chironomus riparius]|uniref:DNA/RNA non-specific endonuclease domain-containing protein n=1 Tax=Chironomus riparius TaxID=315576 RepID=A0A9N9RWC7_9DIPT|nr:unnamed protein product [Chironomus riparius]